jgi:hypothetical protein
VGLHALRSIFLSLSFYPFITLYIHFHEHISNNQDGP